jgi:hypothetical protein
VGVHVRDASAQDIALDWARRNYREFVMAKAGTAVLGLELYQSAIAFLAVPPEREFVLPPLPPETFVHDLKAMYATMSHADKYITINCTPSPACHLLVCRELTRGQPSKSASTPVLCQHRAALLLV